MVRGRERLVNDERQKQYEARIARVFCRSLKNNWALVEQPDPPAADCLIGNTSRTVAVELASYRQQGPDNELHEADWAFKTHIHDTWISDASVNETSLHLEYRRSKNRPLVPKPKTRDPLASDLKRLACDDAIPKDGEVEVTFLAATEDDFELPGPPAWRSIATPRYPELEKYFTSVRILRHPGIHLGLPSTSLDVVYLGLDRKELERVLRNKVDNLAGYRTAHDEVWVLVHSDGVPSTAHVPRLHMSDALAIGGDVLSAFDAVYWLEDALSVAGGRLHRIKEPPEH